jgi:ribose transport system ATP-binding protein
VSFELAPGEVLGIGGLVGSGRTTLLELLFGARPAEGGAIEVGGQPVRLRSPRDGMRAGLAYVPEDRARDSAFMDLGIPENMSAADPARYWRGGRFRHRRERDDARTDIAAMKIRAPATTASLLQLSGGNQQKVVLDRWLRRRTQVLLLDEPTQGVDIASRAEIYQLVRRAVADGAAAILVSSDFEELAHVSDRVLVLAGGRVVAQREGVTRDWVTQQAYRGQGDRV